MNRYLRTVVVASFVLLLAGAGFHADKDQPSGQAAPSTQEVGASCVLRLKYVKEDLPLNRDSFVALLSSGGVLGVALRDVPGLTPQMIHDTVHANLWELQELQVVEGRTPVTTALLRLNAVVDPSVPDADAKAAKLLAALSKRLEQALVEHNAPAEARRREAVAAAAKQVTEAEQQLAQVQALQQKLYAEAGQTELSRDRVVADLQGTQREQRQEDMKLAGLYARQSALAEQVARIGKEVEAHVQVDPVAVELQKVVELREQALKREKELKQQGLASGTAAEEALAVARAELAKQRQFASQAAGGNLLADLNKEMVTLAVDIAETEVRRAYLQKRLDEARDKKLLELADRYEREVAPQLGAADRALRDALSRRLEAEETLARYRPVTVTVLGGTGGE